MVKGHKIALDVLRFGKTDDLLFDLTCRSWLGPCTNIFYTGLYGWWSGEIDGTSFRSEEVALFRQAPRSETLGGISWVPGKFISG